MTVDSFKIDFDDLTIRRVDENGDSMDLNKYGYPVSTLSGLRNLADDLYDNGAYGRRVRNDIVEIIDSRSDFLNVN